nr:hypothetical protein [Lysobacter enzymogenes]
MRDAQLRGFAGAAQAQQQRAHQRVRGEDVAVEQQRRVQRADQPQPQQAPAHARRERLPGARGGGLLQAEAVAEQEREQQVELHLEQGRDQRRHDAVERRGKRRVGHAQSPPRRGEHADVDQRDAEQGEAAQGVEVFDARGAYSGNRRVHARAAIGDGRMVRRAPGPGIGPGAGRIPDVWRIKCTRNLEY